jgi:hypothetical protein
MATKQQKGNCYLCGAELGKVAMKNHILKVHSNVADEQQCRLLKVEGADKRYWLFLDAPLTASLQDIDDFLRRIWLECCGHMSAFMGPGYEEYPMSRKLIRFPEGTQLLYEYDFGDTTHLLVSILGRTRRKPQKEVVRLLARNRPIEWKCAECGQPAEYIFPQQFYRNENPFLCEACADKLDDMEMEMSLPVTNSPRMGVCSYEGDWDHYGFEEYAECNNESRNLSPRLIKE